MPSILTKENIVERGMEYALCFYDAQVNSLQKNRKGRIVSSSQRIDLKVIMTAFAVACETDRATGRWDQVCVDAAIMARELYRSVYERTSSTAALETMQAMLWELGGQPKPGSDIIRQDLLDAIVSDDPEQLPSLLQRHTYLTRPWTEILAERIRRVWARIRDLGQTL